MKKIIISGLLLTAILFAGCASKKTPITNSTGTINSGEIVDVTGTISKSESVERKELIGPTSGNLYYIVPGDAGASGEKIGCDDSLIKVETKLSGGNLGVNLENLYIDLLSGKTLPANAINSLEVSFIKVIDIKTSPELIQVNLSGTMGINGTCDLPRIKAQLENTVNQFGIDSEINLNGRPLQDTLDSF